MHEQQSQQPDACSTRSAMQCVQGITQCDTRARTWKATEFRECRYHLQDRVHLVLLLTSSKITVVQSFVQGERGQVQLERADQVASGMGVS